MAAVSCGLIDDPRGDDADDERNAEPHEWPDCGNKRPDHGHADRDDEDVEKHNIWWLHDAPPLSFFLASFFQYARFLRDLHGRMRAFGRMLLAAPARRLLEHCCTAQMLTNGALAPLRECFMLATTQDLPVDCPGTANMQDRSFGVFWGYFCVSYDASVEATRLR